MNKIAIIMYGPPGSGKGTQANLLAAKLDIIHFDTGRFCEALVHGPDRQKEKIIQRERKLFDSGILMTPSFVLKEIVKHVKAIAKTGHGLIFSGSPRTIYEAERLMPVLETLYDKRNIFVFELKMRESFSVKRNGRRILCSVCKAPLLTAYYPSKNPKHCPVCAGPFYKRTLDKPETIKIRLKQYRERTEPIVTILKKRGYKIFEVSAEPAPYKIFHQIYGHLKNRR
ncbi:MAG: nucleoside monophosphate kinase [Candidatus Liptonbacteria bacterium]|nr:nucleoside monophosphate kinase [Candidatus Liptonbacteria bacterium]